MAAMQTRSVLLLVLHLYAGCKGHEQSVQGCQNGTCPSFVQLKNELRISLLKETERKGQESLIGKDADSNTERKVQPQPKVPLFEDCWGACGSKAGYCAACEDSRSGRKVACCKYKSSSDPEECKFAGFGWGGHRGHQCVTVEKVADKIGTEVRFISKNFPTHVLRIRNYEAWLDKAEDSNLFRMDSSFVVRSGLAGTSSISFESKRYPKHFLRHYGYDIFLHEYDGSSVFKKDASFYERSPLFQSSGFNSYESWNFRQYYLRHANGRLSIAKLAGNVNPQDFEKQDATWKLE